MKTVKRILFPFSGLFERRNLKLRWWHRLFVVVFFVGFLLFGLAVAALVKTNEDNHRHELVLGASPDLTRGSSSSGVDFDYIGYAIEPPRGTKALDIFDRLQMETAGIRAVVPKVGVVAFPQNMPEAQINLFCQNLYDSVSAAEHRERMKDWAIYVIWIAVVFYAAQIGYRLFLYIVLSPEAHLVNQNVDVLPPH